MERIIAPILSVSLFCSILTAYAEDNIPQIDMNNKIVKNEVTIDSSEIPTITYNDSYGVPLSENNISLYSDFSFPTESESRVIPEIEISDTLEIPANKTEHDEGGWISSNEVDEEDLVENISYDDLLSESQETNKMKQFCCKRNKIPIQIL